MRRQRTSSRPYRRWGKGKGVRRQPVGGGVCYSWGEILHFKQLTRVGGKSDGRPDFKKERKKNKKSESFFPLNFNVYIDLDKMERA